MYKIRVHIKNENNYNDEDVFVDIKLPGIPRKKDLLYLTKEQMTILENKVKKSLTIAQCYAPKWFYGRSHECTVPQEKNLDDFSFEDAINVDSIAFYGDSDIIHIELDS